MKKKPPLPPSANHITAPMLPPQPPPPGPGNGFFAQHHRDNWPKAVSFCRAYDEDNRAALDLAMISANARRLSAAFFENGTQPHAPPAKSAKDRGIIDQRVEACSVHPS